MQHQTIADANANTDTDVNIDVASLDAAIIDLDGTMIDTLDDFVAALSLTLVDLSLPPVTRAEVARWIGKGSAHLVKMAVNRPYVPVDIEQFATIFEYDEDSSFFQSALARYQMHYRQVNGLYSNVYAGVVQGLEQLHALGLTLACLTNKPGVFAVELLKAKGLARYFEHVFGGDAFERQKPDPLPVLKTCDALRTVPARTLVIGDSANDAMAAHAAGCPVMLVTYGYNHGLPVTRGPALACVDSLAALPLLKRAQRLT